MFYCRFENTLRDLRDCHSNLTGRLPADEADARMRLVETCADILDELGLLPKPITGEQVVGALEACVEEDEEYVSAQEDNS
jgi:hypothetical protein